MSAHNRDLPALIGSRICHDLISPLGAIGNGVELMQLSGVGDSPEMGLISQAVTSANLRIRFFRIAFGAANPGQMTAESDIRALVAPSQDGRRIEIDWGPQGDQPRTIVKLVFLLIQCCETAMPRGGKVRVLSDGDSWQIEARADVLNADPAMWNLITSPEAPTELLPAQVHFALVAPEMALQERQATLALTQGAIRVTF